MQQRVSQPTETTEIRPAQVSTGLVASVRAMLLEEGLWPRVREALARRDPEALEELEDEGHRPWSDLSAYVALHEAIADVVGLDAVRELGRGRVSHERGFFARAIRSWLRSFGEDPALYIRLTVPLWNATLRGAGTLELRESRPGHVHMRIQRCAPALVRSAAWQASAEGMWVGGLAVIGLSAKASVTPARDDPRALDYLICWDAS